MIETVVFSFFAGSVYTFVVCLLAIQLYKSEVKS